jgi:hypothetical protein
VSELRAPVGELEDVDTTGVSMWDHIFDSTSVGRPLGGPSLHRLPIPFGALDQEAPFVVATQGEAVAHLDSKGQRGARQVRSTPRQCSS